MSVDVLLVQLLAAAFKRTNGEPELCFRVSFLECAPEGGRYFCCETRHAGVGK